MDGTLLSPVVRTDALDAPHGHRPFLCFDTFPRRSLKKVASIRFCGPPGVATSQATSPVLPNLRARSCHGYQLADYWPFHGKVQVSGINYVKFE